MRKRFMSLAEDAEGYPSYAFEAWYQQGMSCYMARLPKTLRRQAFKHLARKWQSKGSAVAMWQVRAFVYGAMGKDHSGQRSPYVPEGYQWPIPPDASWQLVVCVYSGGEWDLDFAHPISRKFWSEDNGFLDLPQAPANVFQCQWFKDMGFEVMHMQPAMSVIEGRSQPHLHAIK
ncbi:MAG TPA: hypothetical protein VJ654_12695 [Noviherbaspirillum sp.]|nr:hypothetical protein [Noviherbaspirillum sp.]